MLAKPPPRSLPAKPIPLKEQVRLMCIQLLSVSIFILHLIWFAVCLSNTVGSRRSPRSSNIRKGSVSTCGHANVSNLPTVLQYCSMDGCGIMFPPQLCFFGLLMLAPWKGFWRPAIYSRCFLCWHILGKDDTSITPPHVLTIANLPFHSQNSEAPGQLLARCGHLSPKCCLGHRIACNSRPDSLVCKQRLETETKEDKVVYSEMLIALLPQIIIRSCQLCSWKRQGCLPSHFCAFYTQQEVLWN